MTGMRLIGVRPRALEAKQALNRLRWEVDHAIGQGEAEDAASLEVAEAVALVRQILLALDQALPAGPAGELEGLLGSARARFQGHINWFTGYHGTAR